MSIADKITSITNHLEKDYQALESVVGKVSVNKNIENIAPLLDNLWEELPHTTGSGTSLSLSNTKKGKAKVDLKGNTSQVTTTGKNLAKVTDADISSSNYSLKIQKGLINITTTGSENSLDLCSGTRTGTYLPNYANANDYHLTPANQGTYKLSISNTIANITGTANQPVAIYTNQRLIQPYINPAGSLLGTTSFTLEENEYVKSVYLWTNGSTTISKLEFNLQLESGSTATSFEPYTNGASPNPSYPQPVNVVSGDNEVVVTGKNIFDGNAVSTTTPANWGVSFENDILTIQHKTEWSTGTPTLDLGTLNSGTYVLSGTLGDKLSLYINGTYNKMLDNGTTFTCDGTQNIQIRISVDENTTKTYKNVMLEKSSTPSTYEPYTSTSYPIHLGEYELCKISTYQDRFLRNSGKNLFDKTLVTDNKLIDRTTGELANNKSYKASDYIPVKANTTYCQTNTNYYYSVFYDTNKTYLGVCGTTSFTPTQDGYVRTTIANADIDKVMINEGSTALPYEPYGNGDLYLEKHIGKVVLDGSEDENWNDFFSTQGFFRYVPTIFAIGTYNTINGISNYFTCTTREEIRTLASTCNTKFSIVNAELVLVNTSITSINDFKTWLSTHNTIVYYILATPTYTKIEGTLKDELDEVYRAYSYNGQTNVSQSNNDLPFELNITALEG